MRHGYCAVKGSLCRGGCGDTATGGRVRWIQAVAQSLYSAAPSSVVASVPANAPIM